MSIQRGITGKSFPKMPPSRTIIYSAMIIFIFFTLVSYLRSPTSSMEFNNHQMPLPKLPKISTPNMLNPFRQSAHPPPFQKNSTSGDASWYSNLNWLSPFSSSVTLDENRSLLPPLPNRPPIYTYYDSSEQQDVEVSKYIEQELLLTWRRAWWAQGFNPIILGSAETTSNPRAEEFHLKEVEATLRFDLSRWLAWETMGTGIMCDYLLLPMGRYDDTLFTHLRRGEYAKLTRFENLGSGIFAGSKSDITNALKQILANRELLNSQDFIHAVSPDTFLIEPKHEVLAYYDKKTISEKYPKIANDVNGQGEKGLMMLNELMASHLHITWQNIFHQGIAVTKPLPKHMTALIEPALTVARSLATCPKSPLPSSCPPNFLRCKPCVASQPLKISTPSVFLNSSSLYTLGIVPHPHTNALLASSGREIDVAWIRRFSERDPWILAVTKDLLGTGVSGPSRVMKFKEAVASEYGAARSLWVTAENSFPQDLEWHFGFKVPSDQLSDARSETPVPGPERRPKKEHDPADGPEASEDDLRLERELLEKAREWSFGTKNEEQLRIRGAIEAWNLADVEAWKFTRAFLARKRMEKLKWLEEEKQYLGGIKPDRQKE
ncbi:Bgt-3255 [Blumeria graminis f. sp. tritici]|uniref:Bgt-3255 n=2 Tax=Blumeria graminis f. sp. tritici TaxID=62690 RepID=A0A381LIU1_BLUGR|nr:hypothetical protein BGT96224_3255 [Blumeria graminis f. sp. tritici 96224]VDB93024.1 Bgt-3255 [Blumeria graminis f. sp. tritici]